MQGHTLLAFEKQIFHLLVKSQFIGWKSGNNQSEALCRICSLIGQYKKSLILLANFIMVWFGIFI